MTWIRQPRFSAGVRASLVAATLVTLLAAPAAFAASQTWDGGGGNGSWQTVTNWIGDVGFPGTASAVYTSTDDATFGGVGSGTVSLGGSLNVRSLIFGTAGADASAFTIGGTGDTLYLTTGGSITINAGVTTNQTIGVAGMTINTSTAASATATITNNGSGLLTIAGNIAANVASGNGLLTVAGSGSTTITGTITKPGAGSNALLKTGAGTLTLAASSVWNGTGAATTGFSGPLTAQAGTLLFAGGTHTITGEAVIGGVITNGGAGNNAKIQVDAGAVNISSWLSVGRGNGVGGVSSDLVLNNSAVMTAANLSAGYNAGSASNLPKGSITLNGSSSLTITGNGVFNLAESVGSNVSMVMNGSSTFTSAGTGLKYIGNGGTGSFTLNGGIVSLGSGDLMLGNVTGSGTLTINGGTFTNNGVTAVAVSAAASNTTSGAIFVNGGTLTSGNDLVVGLGGSGAAGSTGTLTISGGVVNVGTTTKRWMILGRFDTVRAGVSISSGTLNLNTNTDLRFATGNASTASSGTFTQSGGAVTFYGDNATTVGGSGIIDMQQNGSATASSTYNLDGGTLTTNQIASTVTLGSRTFNFNGGTLKVASGTYASTFVNLGSGSAVANVRNGGAIIDTNGFSVTIPQLLAHSTIGGDAATDGGLTKLGSGTLTLSGNNTYTGATTISAGSLRASGTSALGAASGNIVAQGGVLDLGSNNFTRSGTISFTGGTVQTGTLTNNTAAFDGQSGTVSAVLAGSVGLTKSTSGTLALSAANTYVGATAISSGTLVLSGSGSVNSSNSITINGSGAGLSQFSTVAATPAITLTRGMLAGTGTVGAVTVNGTGGVVMNGNADTTTFTLGSLSYSATGAVTLNLANDLVTPAVAVTGTLATVQGITLNVATSPGWVSGNTYNLISYGSLTGSGTNFVAGTIVGLGARQAPAFGDTGASNGYVTLTIQGDTPYWTGAGSNAWTTGTGTLDWSLLIGGSSTYFITNDQVLFDDNASGSTAVDISTGNVGIASVVFSNSSKDYTITSSGGYGIADGSATPAPLTKNGTGRATLATPNTYTGATTINAGTLQLGDGVTDGTLASPSVANAAALEFAVVGSTTYAGVISGTGTVTKSGAGTLTLSGTNTGTGIVTIAGGVLNVTGGLANTAPVTVSGGVYTVGAGDTVGAVTLASGTINGAGVLTASSYALQNGTVAASLAGAGAITKTTSGTVTLTGSNAPTTNVTLSAGRLNINHASALGATTTGTLVINGGTIDTTTGSALTTTAAKAQTWAGDFSTGSGTLSFNNGVATVTGAGTRTLTLGGGLLTVGSISSTGNALTIAGSGTLALSANSGLNVSSATKIGGLLTVNSGATLQINTGTTDGTTGDLLASMLGGSGTITTSNVARWIYLNGSGVSGTFAGTLAGPLGLCADNGSGAITLSGNNTLTDRITSGTNWTVILTGNNVGRPAGTTSLTYVANGGTLQLQANGGNTVSGTSFALSSERTANSPLTLNNGSTLRLRGDSDVTFAGGNSLGGLGSATVTIDVNAISGGTTGKTLTIAPGGFDVNRTTLNVTGGNDFALGLGTITDTYGTTGTTTINANTGRVTLGGFASTATANTHVLALGGAMAGNTVTGSISNGTGSAVTAVVKNDAGTWTLTGTSGYTGSTTINSGTLALGGAGLLGNGNYAGTITNNGSLVVATSANQTLAGVVSGQGALAKTGAGTLTLSAANTYTGSTIISGGTLALGSNASLASTYLKAGAAAGDGGVLDVLSLGSGLNVASGQTLGGYGTVLGNVTIAGGAIVAPGGSIGALTNTGTETWGAAGHYLFEITNAGGTTPGTSWDLLTVSALSITATAGIGNQFVIDLQSLTSGTDQSAGAMTGGNWDPTANYEWKFLVADTTTFSSANFDTSWFTVTTSTSTFPNSINGSFYVARGGNDGGLGGSTNSNELYVVYAAVPEPGTVVLAATGAALAALFLRRRRVHHVRCARGW